MRAWKIAVGLAAVLAAVPVVALAQEHAEHAAHAVNWNELLWQIIDFLVVVIVLVVFGRKPLAQFLATRRKNVAEALEEAQRLKADAEAKEKEYRGRLERLNDEIDELRKEMIKAGEAERDRIVADAEAKASRMRKETEFVIDQQMKQLRVDLTREAVEAAITAAQEVLTREAGPADQERLSKLYLERLAASKQKEGHA